MPDIENITVRQEMANGSKIVVLVGEWPVRTVFAEELLEAADSDYLHVAGDEIVLTLSNATATYRRIYNDEYGAWVYDLVERCRN